MPDYSKGKIYRLTCDDPELVYYGSTVLLLSQRKSIHKANYLSSGRYNCSSSKLYDVGGVEIELVLECPCESLRELREIEQTYIDNDTCVNKKKAFRTLEQKNEYIANYSKTVRKTDKVKNYMREYNKSEKYKAYQKEYQKTYQENYRNFRKLLKSLE